MKRVAYYIKINGEVGGDPRLARLWVREAGVQSDSPRLWCNRSRLGVAVAVAVAVTLVLLLPLPLLLLWLLLQSQARREVEGSFPTIGERLK